MRALSLGLACCAFARAATPSNRGGGGTLARLALLKTRRPHLLPNLGYGACLSACRSGVSKTKGSWRYFRRRLDSDLGDATRISATRLGARRPRRSLLQDELALRCVGMSAATFFFLQNIGNVLVPANSVNWKGAVMQTALVAGHFARTRQSVRTRLAVRRRDLSARELELYDLVFRDLQVTLRQYKAMLGAGARWGSDDVGVKLAREGRKHDRVLIILEGRCELSQSDVVVETLGPGNTVAVRHGVDAHRVAAAPPRVSGDAAAVETGLLAGRRNPGRRVPGATDDCDDVHAREICVLATREAAAALRDERGDALRCHEPPRARRGEAPESGPRSASRRVGFAATRLLRGRGSCANGRGRNVS